MPVAVNKNEEEIEENMGFIEGLKYKAQKRIEHLQKKYSKKRNIHGLAKTFVAAVFISLVVGYEICCQRLNNTLFKYVFHKLES